MELHVTAGGDIIMFDWRILYYKSGISKKYILLSNVAWGKFIFKGHYTF